MKKFPLHLQILVALILGILFGAFFGEYTGYVDWMGDIFLRALKMIIIPLILSSIISGVTNIGTAENLGRLGLKTIVYYLSTSVLAIVTGLLFVNLLQPGVGADLGFSKNVEELSIMQHSFGQTLINIIPTNIFAAFSQASMLSIIFFAIIFGFFINLTSEKSRTFLTTFFDATFEVMMKITMFIIRFAPFGVFGIVAFQVSQSESISVLAQSMGLYMLTVFLGLAVHAFITLPLITRFVNELPIFKIATGTCS